MTPLTAREFRAPMAVIILGGLVIATLLSLLFLPALHAVWFNVRHQ